MELFSGIPMPAVSSLPRWRRLRPTRDARGRGRNPFILLGNAPQTTVDAGASIDLAGLSAIISDPLGGGAVIDRGTTATLTLGAPNFLGHDLGPLRPVFHGNASLIAVPTSPLGFRHRAAGRVPSCCLRFREERGRAEGRREIHAKALKSLISRKEKRLGASFRRLGEDFRAKTALYPAIIHTVHEV